MPSRIIVVDGPLKGNLVSFHLLENDFPCGSLTGETPVPSKIKILAEPLLSDPDFIAWNPTKHTFTITHTTFKRMADKWSTAQRCPAGIPFVLMASGSPIYIGVFGSQASSISTVVPTAIPYPDVTQEKVGARTDFTTNTIFEIGRAYPSDELARGPDPRDDKRLLAAVEKLFGKQGNRKSEIQGQQKSGTNAVTTK
jgi:hypothetical protein